MPFLTVQANSGMCFNDKSLTLKARLPKPQIGCRALDLLSIGHGSLTFHSKVRLTKELSLLTACLAVVFF